MHRVALGVAVALVTILATMSGVAAAEDVQITNLDAEWVGEAHPDGETAKDVAVTFTIENNGGSSSSVTPVIELDDQSTTFSILTTSVRGNEITVGAGEAVNVELLGAGIPDEDNPNVVTAEVQDSSFNILDSDTTEVWVPEPPELGDFEVTGSISLSRNEVEPGDGTTASISVTNTRDQQGQARISVQDRSNYPEIRRFDSRIKALDSGETVEYNVDVWTEEGDTGEREIDVFVNDVSQDSATLTLTDDAEPATGFEVSIVDTNSPVKQGETLEVTAEVENTQDSSASQNIELGIAGEGESTSISLDSGESETVILTRETTGLEEGDYIATVSSDDNSDTTTVTIDQPDEPEPASFVIRDVEIADKITAGEELDVTAEIRNTGEESDSQYVELDVVGNSVVDSERLALEGGEGHTVELTWQSDKDEEGEHQVTVRTEDDSVTNEVKVEPLPNLEIERVRPVQTVFNASVDGDSTTDLVEDKKTAVLVYPGGSNLDKLRSNREIDIEVEGPWSKTISNTFSTSEYRDTVQASEEPNSFFVLKTTFPEGNQITKSVTAAVDPNNEIEESSRKDNEVSEKVSIYSTEEMKIGYYSVESELRLLPEEIAPRVGEYRDHIEESDKFVNAVFPVAASDYSSKDRGTYSTTVSSTELGVALTVWRLHFISHIAPQDRIVGVVHDNYFDVLGLQGARGYAAPGGRNGMLVEVGYWTFTAHELGHSYDLYLEPERYNILSNPGRADEGYYVAEDEYIIDFPEDYPVSANKEVPSFMSNEGPFEPSAGDVWIENTDRSINGEGFEDYNFLFKNLRSSDEATFATASTSLGRRDTIAFWGAIHKNRTVKSMDWRYLENDTDFLEQDGDDFTIEAIDTEGNILYTQSFDAPFKAFVSPQNTSPVDTNVTGFVIKNNYPDDVAEFRLVENNTLLREFNPHTNLLRSSVESIPNRAFDTDKGGSKLRTPLLKKIKAIDNMLESGNQRGAVKKIENDLLPALDRWVVDDYKRDGALEMTKEEVIQTTEVVNWKLKSQIECPSGSNVDESIIYGLECPGDVKNPGQQTDSSPEQSDEHPGRGIGPDGTPPGHGGEHPDPASSKNKGGS